MFKTYIVVILFAEFMIACGNSPSGKKEGVQNTPAPPVYKMDMLEKLFNNDNWMMTGRSDTSYYYFSRNPSAINVSRYKLIKGDSAMSNLSVIRFSGDSLLWEHDDTTRLFLTGITDNSAEWSKDNVAPGKLFLAFAKQNEQQIKVTDANNNSFTLSRTLPLSTFLVRSRYDYTHGTKYAFSDTVFSTGKKK